MLKRIFYLMDICGNKMVTNGVFHMSGPSGSGRSPGLGRGEDGGKEEWLVSWPLAAGWLSKATECDRKEASMGPFS